MPETPAVLTIQNLSTIFANGNGGLHALDRLSFEVGAEEFVCVLGPSGCGKTTLMKSMNRLTDLYPEVKVTGNIFINDEDILGVLSAED